jgi:hypothetical protein
MTGDYKLWTSTDIRRAAEIWQRDFADHHGDGDGPWGAQGKVFATIAAVTRKTVGSVAGRFDAFGPSFSAGTRGGPSAQAVAELERRNAARDRRDLTSIVLGDPPPGYSALDRKRSGHGPRL